MFGEKAFRVCCGPRCGTVPGHRAIYDAVERAVVDVPVLPTMCRGLCGDGVTVVKPDGEIIKILSPEEAFSLTGTKQPQG